MVTVCVTTTVLSHERIFRCAREAADANGAGMLTVVDGGRAHGVSVGIEAGVIDGVAEIGRCIMLQGNVAGGDLWRKKEGLVVVMQTDPKKQGQYVLTRRNRH